MYINMKKVKKWNNNGVLVDKITKKVKKDCKLLIDDFLYLAHLHKWYWSKREINYDSVVSLLVELSIQLLVSDSNCYCTGRLGVYKEEIEDTDDIFLDFCIQY